MPISALKTLRTRARNWAVKKVPNLFWGTYSRRAVAAGFDRLYLVMSFDCDTQEDVPAAATLDEWLRRIGIKPAYAVPGRELELGAGTYRSIAANGAEFLNHGYRPHTQWRDGEYHSVTFYDEMASDEVVDDIRRGHETVARILGKVPKGFRAPHFGCFQSEAQLGLQYATLTELGYRFSTSTLPDHAFRYGPVRNAGGIWEVPLTGSLRFPFQILDSWSNLESPSHRVVKPVYGQMFLETVEGLLRMGAKGVLNVYVDPCHVHDSPHFRSAMENTRRLGVESLDYTELLDLVEAAAKSRSAGTSRA